MPRLVRTVPVGSSAEHGLRAPRQDVVREHELAPGRFEAERGPFVRYERTLEQRDGTLVETIDYRLAPGATVLAPLFRRSLQRPSPRGVPWWAPPQVFDARAATALAVLCALAVISGYLGTLLTQTITFAAEQFDAGTGEQGTALASVRIGVIGSLVITTLADRQGRRRFLLVTLAAACVATAAGAVAPSLAALAITQTVVRGLVTAAGVIIVVLAAEEVPAGSRAYALGLVAMSSALGVGMALWVLPLADLGPGTWRVLYVLALLGLPALAVLGRHLPESRRFTAAHRTSGELATPRAPRRTGGRRRARARGVEPPLAGHARRFWLLGMSALLVNLFVAPASQFQNEFLRDERSFSAARITLFLLLTNTPGAIGVLVGARLADVRGRRIVGAVAVLVGAGCTLLARLVDGWEMWAASLAGAVVGAATVPALGVYGPELFPTAMRNRVNTVITLLGVVGSSIGLVAAGRLAAAWDGFGPALALLAVGPLVMAVLVIAAYPETARRELEELNPEDREHPPPPPGPASVR